MVSLSCKLAVCLLCDADKDCFGDYKYCCGGYCKKSCNSSCVLSSDCGSLGHLQEKCCNNKCVEINTVCPQMENKKTRLTSTHIAVLVVCIVVFILIGVCALVMFVCKCGLFNRRRRSVNENRTNPANAATQRRVFDWRRFLHRYGCLRRDDDYLNAQMYTSTSESWVGKDFIQSSKPAYYNRTAERQSSTSNGL